MQLVILDKNLHQSMCNVFNFLLKIWKKLQNVYILFYYKYVQKLTFTFYKLDLQYETHTETCIHEYVSFTTFTYWTDKQSYLNPITIYPCLNLTSARAFIQDGPHDIPPQLYYLAHGVRSYIDGIAVIDNTYTSLYYMSKDVVLTPSSKTLRLP